MNANRERRLWWILIALISAAAAVLLLIHTRNGPGITGDSVHYVMGAENLFEGRGYARTGGGGEAIPITGFPPGYSLSLVLVRLFSPDLFAGAQIFNVLLFGINVFLVGWLVFRFSGRAWPAVAAAGLIVLSEDMLHVHAWIMSEPLFLTLMLLSFWVLIDRFPRGRFATMAVLGLLAAAATMVRYVGFSLAALVGLWTLFAGGKTWKARLLGLAVFSLCFLLPVLIWFARNASLADTLVNRAIGYHPLDRKLITAFLGTMNAWFFPIPLGLPTPVRAGISAALFLLLPARFALQTWRRLGAAWMEQITGPRSLPWMMIVFLPLYAGLLLINSMFLDASTSPSGAARYLAPLFVTSVLLIACSLISLAQGSMKKPLWRVAAIGIASLALILYGIGTYDFVGNPGDAFRYTDSKRNDPALVEALVRLGEEHILFSNDIERIYAISRQLAYALPILYDHYQQAYREDFEQQMAFTQEKLEAGAIVVFFDQPTEEDEDILNVLGLMQIEAFPSADLFQRGG